MLKHPWLRSGFFLACENRDGSGVQNTHAPLSVHVCVCHACREILGHSSRKGLIFDHLMLIIFQTGELFDDK